MNRATKALVTVIMFFVTLVTVCAGTMVINPSSIISVADIAAMLSSWGAGIVTVGLVWGTAKNQFSDNFTRSVALVVICGLYFDHIYHEMQLEANAAAAHVQQQ